jgi:xanthine dehydrogenase small subunit
MSDRIRFLLGHRRREIEVDDPTMTVLNYLRLAERRTGTKEGCAEGDCGACTVVLGELAEGRLTYRAVNACIQFLPALDGKQLITVEDLAPAPGRLHPVQQAMVDCHASQCGFCTPGFVMSLFALFHEPDRARPDRARIDDALAGNLCRCTGYGPIIAAAGRMKDLAEADGFDERQAETAAVLGEWEERSAKAITARDGRRWFAPRGIEQLAELYLAHPEACLLAGATDVGLWVTKQQRRLDPIIYLGGVDELQHLAVGPQWIEIGAGVTYDRLRAVIAAEYPDFGEILRRLGSTQIRNCATMGGNIANGSPIGDSPPPLIALGCRLVLRRGAARREIALEEFFQGYGKQDRAPGEFVESLRLPRRDPARRFACYKLSKRFDQDITACLGAFNLMLRHGRVADIRICYGGMAATPKRARACEDALIGKPWTLQTVREGQEALQQDFAPISDMRASKDYRALASRNLLLKLFHETTGAAETRVLERARPAHG